jgi:Ser/Thr protein kinase RdoA (MazF antagonist)
MQPNVFEPNNHSQWRIRCQSVPAAVFKELSGIFLALYSTLGDDVVSIEQVAETEINSNNFKIVVSQDGAHRAFLFRRYPEHRDETTLRAVYEAIEFLRSKGIKAPRLLPSDSEDLLLTVSPWRYSVFEFVESDHYRGTVGELESAAEEFGRLNRELLDLPGADYFRSAFVPSPAVAALREFSSGIWRELFDRVRERQKEHADDEFDARLLRFEHFIMEAIAKTQPGRYAHLPYQVVHSDLHPHNLLTDDMDLRTILDFDSLRFLERVRGVAFALHRLVRQHIVYAKPADTSEGCRNACEVFLTAYQREGALTKEEISAIPYFIRHEALSRLSYAMKDFYYNGNPAWKGDLEKQTAAIAEAAYFE